MKGVSDLELITRLTYAETLGAKCPGKNDELFPAIASVIFNRVKAFGGAKDAVHRTVFGRKQFASSLHSYSASEWRQFVCPGENESLYDDIHAHVRKLFANETSSLFPTATHYYLNRHFGKLKSHPWGHKAKVLSTLGGDCLTIIEESKNFLKAPFS